VELEELLRITVAVHPPIDIGPTPAGDVRVIPFDDGTFTFADGVSGRLLDGGTDWQHVRPDGVVEIRARYLLETEHGERIQVTSDGIRHAAPGVLERIAAGEQVDPAEYYFRTFIRLNTGAPRLAHLNRLLVIGRGRRTRDAVELTFYAVP
jgi:Protein of unknown function (DUF3237)